MVQFDKGFKKERAKMKKLLRDSVCYVEFGKKCSVNCDMLHICDACYDEDILTPFCFWSFKDVIYGKSIIIDVDGDTVCKEHGHEEVKKD